MYRGGAYKRDVSNFHAGVSDEMLLWNHSEHAHRSVPSSQTAVKSWKFEQSRAANTHLCCHKQGVGFQVAKERKLGKGQGGKRGGIGYLKLSRPVLCNCIAFKRHHLS